jgi:L-aspartate oxidase
MKDYDELAELAPRDIVSRAIFLEMKKTNSDKVYLDISHLDAKYIRSRFPTIYKKCREYKIDITKHPIPVIPAAHYMCGGVSVDLDGRTSIEGLYALGEVACNGINGANRLASNSMMEGMVFSERIYKHSLKKLKRKIKIVSIKDVEIRKRTGNEIRKILKKIMWEKVGIVRSEKELWDALEEIDKLQILYDKIGGVNRRLVELRNMLIVAKSIVKSALKRKKSIGCHYRI